MEDTAKTVSTPILGLRSAPSDQETAQFQSRMERVIETARTLPPGSDEETQDELGLILQLLPAVERSHDLALLGNIELAVDSLLAKPPNRLLAIRLREAAQQSIVRRNFVRSILPGTSASTWVIYGMAILLYVAVPVLILLTYFLIPDGGVSVGGKGGSHEGVAYSSSS